MIRSRFAPSPTGRMHLGSLRTALLVWLDARARGGKFILRMEDLDQQREIKGAADQILEDLEWLGLDWDEGPDVGGPFVPYKQSERFGFYKDEAKKLLDRGLLYPCVCTRRDIELATVAPAAGDEGPPYPGTCRGKSLEELGGKKAALRFHVKPGKVAFQDRVFGKITQEVSEEIGDFVVVRKDAAAAYQLAVVLDDIAMEITDVVRGADLLSSTPRQILLYEALEKKIPAYAHVPLMLAASGEKFSKRERSVHVGALREAGWKREKLVGWLAWTAGVTPRLEPAAPKDLLPGFSLEKIKKEDARVDVGMLIGT